MPNFTPYSSNVLEDDQFRNELKALIQEEIWKAFDVAMKAAVDPPVPLHQLENEEFLRQRELHKKVTLEVNSAIRSALSHLKAEAQARVVEPFDRERAERIRALADPTF